MAEDMIERAARAVHEYQYTSAWEDRSPRARDLLREDIKVAMAAALDPEDEALVTKLAEVIYGRQDMTNQGWGDWSDEARDEYMLLARSVIEWLRSRAAQGERAGQPDMREKDND